MGSETSTDGATVGESTHKTREESGWLLTDVWIWRCFSWCSLLSSSLVLQLFPLNRKYMSSPLLCCCHVWEVVRVLPQPKWLQRCRAMWAAVFWQHRLNCSLLGGDVALWHNPPMKTVAQVFSQLVVPAMCWKTGSIASNQCRHPNALLIPAVFPPGGRSVLHLPHVLYRGPPKKGSPFFLWPFLMWNHSLLGLSSWSSDLALRPFSFN